MFRASMGRGDGKGFADALALLKRGADFRRAAKDGTTLASILREDVRWFAEQHEEAPASFDELVQWLRAHEVAIDQ